MEATGQVEITITERESLEFTGPEAVQPEITWKTVTRKISELSEWEQNPRVITERAFKQMVESIQQDGYHNRIKITQDNLIIGGHQRRRALLAAGLSLDTEIEVLQAQEPLTPDQFGRVNLRDNLEYGAFDWDKLANMYDPVQLIEWHMPEDKLPSMDLEFTADSEEGGKAPKEKFDGDTDGHLKMIQLFYSAEEEEEFRSIATALETKVGAVNISDTVLRALRAFNEQQTAKVA